MTTTVTTPVGRIVGGSLYTPTENKDSKGQPKIGKDGLPQTSFWFHVAIPKGTERHWAETEWGAKIWAEGHKGHPGFAPHAGFAWKIEDGDDTTPVLKRKGRRNCDNEHNVRCWLVKLSQAFAPKIYNRDGSVELKEPGVVKAGYYVQVNIEVSCNTGDSPGVYLNPRMVAFSAEGDEISYGPDASEAGFGQNAALPAGARPVAASPAAAVGFGGPAVPPPVVAPPIVPNPAFLAVPVAPPVPPARQMTAAAQGASYEQLIAAGWTDALLVQHGMMAP